MSDPSPGAAAGPVVEFDRATVRYGGRAVLRALDLTLHRGETLVLLGRSGSGKSTSLRLVNRLRLPDEGEVRVGGRSTREWDPIPLRRRIGYVIQEVGLFPHLTVAENVALVPGLLGWDEPRVRERVEGLLARVGLEPARFGARYPRQLSGGQAQRVGVARALAGDPEILLCDEPFGALDPITRHALQREFRDLSRRLGKSLLFVTHDVREALFLGDRIALLEEGGLRFVGTPAALRAADDPAVRTFVEAAALPER